MTPTRPGNWTAKREVETDRASSGCNVQHRLSAAHLTPSGGQKIGEANAADGKEEHGAGRT